MSLFSANKPSTRALKGYNELTKLGIRLTKEIHELKTRAKDHVGKTKEKLPTIAQKVLCQTSPYRRQRITGKAPDQKD